MDYQNLAMPEPKPTDGGTAPGPPATANMSGGTESLGDIFQVYADLARRFELRPPPCTSFPEAGDADAVSEVRRWVEQLDNQFEAYHLRVHLQAPAATTEKNLRLLIRHYLAKTARTPSDRDKLDFLLVQYVYCCGPVWGAGLAIPSQDIANTLRPIFGESPKISQSFLEAVEPILSQVGTCESLSQLIQWGCVDQGRLLKEAVGESFYEPEALVAFTWLNFVLRRACFRLLHSDVEAIREGLLLLEERGIHEVDCRRAELSKAEPVDSLLKLCDAWTQLFRSPYSQGRLAQIAAIRSAVEAALQYPASGRAIPETFPLPANAVGHKVPPILGGWPDVPICFDDIVLPSDELLSEAWAPGTTVEAAASEATQTFGEFAVPSGTRSEVQSSNWSLSSPAALEECMESFRSQLSQKAVQGKDPMVTVLYKHTRLLLHSWESESFRSTEGFGSHALQCAVGARAILAEAQELFWSSGDAGEFRGVIELAENQVGRLKECIERARRETSLEVAADLSASSKRLQIAIIKAKGLLGGR